MNAIARIDDEVIGVDDFIRILKLTGQFASLVEQMVRDRLVVHAAKRQGLMPAPEEVQERADQFRRVLGLHRAADTSRYLSTLGVTLDEFEAFITDGLYQEKMMEKVCDSRAVEEYFRSHSPRFDSVEVRHMVLGGAGEAREMMSVLHDEPASFEDMAREHSVAETQGQGGVIGKVMRGILRAEIEAKVFNAAPGELLGPFPSADGAQFEIFSVGARHAARLDDETAAEIRRLLREQWLAARAQEHVIEAR